MKKGKRSGYLFKARGIENSFASTPLLVSGRRDDSLAARCYEVPAPARRLSLGMWRALSTAESTRECVSRSARHTLPCELDATLSCSSALVVRAVASAARRVRFVAPPAA